MHVLIVSQYFWPEEFRINDLAGELVLRGHQVTVLTGEPNYPKGLFFPEYKTNPSAFEHYNGVKIVRVPHFPRKTGSIALVINYLSFVLSACTIGIWKIRKIPFDVIFSPQLSPVTAMLPAILIRKLRGKKFVMWVLDLWPDTLRALGVVKSERILGWVGRLVSYIYHRTDKLFVQSKGFVPNVLKYTNRPVEIEFLPNWSEEMPDLADVETIPQIPVRQHSFNVMFAGAVGESQDFPTILDAAQLLRDDNRLNWYILGDGRVSDWVATEIIKRNITNFTMLGRHPVDMMPAFYKLADVMLVTLKEDPIFAMTIPGKVQSYLAAGKPIVAMLAGEGASTITASGAGIVVPPGDPVSLASAITAMMQMDRKDLANLGKRGKDYSNREFDRKSIIDRIEYTLKSLI